MVKFIFALVSIAAAVLVGREIMKRRQLPADIGDMAPAI